MSKETIEEAAEKHASLFYDKNSELTSAITESDEWTNRRHNFIEGAAWQAERMYSEDEKFMKFLDTEKMLGLSDTKTIERIKWYFETYFNQNKKQKS